MSIIERAAELLRSSPQREQRDPAGGEKVDTLDRGLIERATGDLVHRRAGESVERPGTTRNSARPAGGTSRQFKVDRNRLRAQSMITPDGERTAIAECFRRIKRQILANISNAKPGAPPANLVMVTSALAGEGKSFCAINLALSLALEMDRTVLFIDTDVAKASIPGGLGLNADKGLMQVLLNRQLDLADVLWKTDIGGLTLLPAGTAPKHATELLASDSMRDLLRDMAERYHDRIVVFDSPPLLAASEAGALAAQVGQIVVVVEASKTSETTLQDALGRIDASRVAGLLLNKVDGPRLEYGHGAYG